ncbi:MAG: VPLPA-CTERM sorting domain-containing protein [Parvularculaceae bacterium]
MKLATLLASSAFALSATAANATIFQFDGSDGVGGAFDLPTNMGNVTSCNSSASNGTDLCTIDDAEGFSYSRNGIAFTAVGFSEDAPSELIQDLIGPNQGLGVITAGESRQTQDQINAAFSESIVVTFDEEAELSNIVLNDGIGNDCPGGGGEGACGEVEIIVDGVSSLLTEFLAGGVLTADGVNPYTATGTVFEFIALTVGGGFSIEEFEVVPVPGALPLLLSGIAGLGFAARRRKSV